MEHGLMDQSGTSLSWILASRRPERLAWFYADLLGTRPKPGLAAHHWIVPFQGGGTLQIYTPSRQRPWPVSGCALAPCLQRRAQHDPLMELQNWQAQVIGLGGRSAEEPRQESFGAECWMEDPEGQRFLMLVLTTESANSEAP